MTGGDVAVVAGAALGAREAKNDVIPDPQELSDGLISGTGGGGVSEGRVIPRPPTRLRGRMPFGVAAGTWGEVSGVTCVLGGRELADLMLLASDFEGSPVAVVDKYPLELPSAFGELFARCIHRPRTPSTALKKLVEPAVNVRWIASRVESSCWSSLRSLMPSASRIPMSATTEGLSVHGCL